MLMILADIRPRKTEAAIDLWVSLVANVREHINYSDLGDLKRAPPYYTAIQAVVPPTSFSDAALPNYTVTPWNRIMIMSDHGISDGI
jgi:hypothetical protein